ncbi:hypothetical protein SAMN05421827_13037 [Pedobacter terrae]|uniref:Uncharacterized protein n=1 Tax=Pedobacter terrae TaxID=405671 RepID=A0A1G8DNG8_9SPHI|nr:hypothetical protein [Pedobacter terrae]SDH59218.1 hypothetical protein SAMN05421827_13037 [Pedobacter terrae]
MDQNTNHILSFLKEIGISYRLESIDTETFLPGLKLHAGTLLIDMEKLTYPGDILHEAGHLACMPPAIRNKMSDNLESGDLHNGGELMAIGWSYAACIYLGIEATFVFHEHGYKDNSKSIIENFSEGRYIGVPLLQWLGMTYDENQAKIHGVAPYPAMQKWLCINRPG